MSTQINDGGNAFPYLESDSNGQYRHHYGMTMRENVKLRAELPDPLELVKEMNALETELARLRAELSAVQAQHLHEIDELAAQAKIMNALRADLERFTGHGLLDCHAICDQRDAAVAERDQLRAEVERLKELLRIESASAQHALAAAERAEKSERLWKEFITLMEITEESDSGNEFNPNKISSCRAMDGKRLNEILNEARQIVFDTPKE